MGYSRKVRKILRDHHDKIVVRYLTHEGESVLVELPSNDFVSIDLSEQKSRNVLKVVMLNDGTIEVNNNLVDTIQLGNLVYAFLQSDPNDFNAPEVTEIILPKIGNVKCANKSIVRLVADYSTTYEDYVKIYEIVHSRYIDLWNDYSYQYFQQESINQLSQEDQQIIKKMLPLRLSED